MLPLAKLTTLSNGFRIVTASLPSSEMVTILVAARVGARAEPPSKRGIAHFVEHLAFKGTMGFPKSTDFDEGVAEIGGYSNASTNMELTYYLVQAPKKQGKEALQLAIEMAAFPRLPAEEFPQEARVVAEEILRHRQDDEAFVEILFEEQMYLHQPLGWEIAGTAETVAALTRKDVVTFRDKWYCPNTMAVAIVGGGDLRALTSKAAEILRPLQRKQAPRWKPFRRTAPRSRSQHLVRDQELVSLEVGVPALPMTSTLGSAQRLLDEVLGGDTDGRMHLRIREKEGLVYVISNISEFYSDAGHTATVTTASVENAPVVLEHILDEHRRIIVDPVTEHELKHAKATAVAGISSMSENQEDLAAMYVRNLLFKERLVQIADIKKRIVGISLDDVRGVAKQLYGQAPFLASIGPKPLRLPKFRKPA